MRLYSYALLAAAVAASAAALAIVDVAFVRPWRVNDFGDLYTVHGLSWPPAQDRVEFWTNVSAFEPLTYLEAGPQRARLGDQPVVLNTVRASSGVLTLLRAQPISGRMLVPSDHEPGAPSVAILSSAFAARAFGSPEQAIGATLHILGVERQVVGVTTAASAHRHPADVWIPRTPEAAGAPRPPDFRTDQWIGRLRPGGTAAEAREQLVSLKRQLAAQAAGTNVSFDGGVFVRPVPLELLVRGSRVTTIRLFVLLAIGFLIFTWIEVLRPVRSRGPTGGLEVPRARNSIIDHPLARALPAVALGCVAAWFWEQDAVAFWFRDLLPAPAGPVGIAARGWSALVAGAIAMLVGVAVLGGTRTIAGLRGRRRTAMPVRLPGGSGG